MWFNLAWNDYQMGWNATEYGGVESVVIHPRNLWIPDILLYNRFLTHKNIKNHQANNNLLFCLITLPFSADERFDGTFQTNIVAGADGAMLYVPPGIFKSTCKIDITWFPFDDQSCDLKFGSWTYTGFKVKGALFSY